MEANSLPSGLSRLGAATPLLNAVRRVLGRSGLIAGLAALPVYCALHDLISG